MTKQKSPVIGSLYAIIACASVSIIIALVKLLAKDYNISFIVMVRNFFSLAIMIPLIIRDWSIISRPKLPILNIIRSLNGFISMSIWFYAITITPLAEAVSISFIVPYLTTIAAIIFLKEKVNLKNWIAIIIGFIGVIIIIRPGFREFKTGYIFVFIAAFCWAISNILTKILSEVQKPEHLVIYLSTIMLIASIPFGINNIKPLNSYSIFLMFLIGLFSNISYYFTSLCYSKTSLAIIQPIDFSRLIFATIIGYWFFNEKVDLMVIIGSIIIMFGIIISLVNKKIKNIPL